MSAVYLEAGDDGLTEDLIEGYVENFHPDRRSSPEDSMELIRELDEITEDHRAMVVRTAHRMFTAQSREAILLRLEREKRNARVRVVFVGEEPHEKVKEWFLTNGGYGVVNEPTFEKLGNWVATKTAGRWDYQKTYVGALVTPGDGLKLAEHCGWDYTYMLQAVKTIRTYSSEPVAWPLISVLIPPKLGFGYADALVFGKGRRSALRLSEGILGEQTLRTLGLVRYYLRQFAKLRAVAAENMSDRVVAEESGVHVWHWRSKYKPVYASFTNDRIRLRLEAVERAMAAARTGAVTAVLEVLVLEW